MGKLIQISMPDEMHRKLKERAAVTGMSLSEFVLRELEPAATERWTREEMIEHLSNLSPVCPDVSSADVLRDARDEREQELS